MWVNTNSSTPTVNRPANLYCPRAGIKIRPNNKYISYSRGLCPSMNLIQITGKRLISKMGVTVKQLVYSFQPRKKSRTTRNNVTGCHRS